jgi:tetratricopeptide (TPR) repeat protein/HEAT repeat protein
VTRLGWVLALLFLIAAPARADWEVRRSPFDPQLIARYKQLLRKDPDDAFALKKLIALYKQHHSLERLIEEYEALPPDAATLLVLGRLEEARGDGAAALRRLESAHRFASDDVRIDVALGDAYLARKRAGDARPLFEAALAHASGARARRPLLRRLADAALADTVTPETLREARRWFDELLALDPRDIDTRRELAEMLAAHGQPKDALVEWRHIAELQRNDTARYAEAWRRIGELCEAADDDAGAREAYRKMWSLVPPGHYLRKEAADKLIGVYRHKDDLRTLIGTWEHDWTKRGFFEWETLARLYDEVGDPARAQECYRKALAADPRALEARRRLIALLERDAKDAEVIAEYRRLIAVAPGEPRFRLELAERLWKAGQSKEAVALCERLGRETGDPSVHAVLADLYTRWGMSDLALAERERLVRLEPDDEGHLVALGELYFQRGKRDKAFEVWRRLLNIGGGGAKREQAMARLAEVYAEHDLPGESLDLYQKAVKLAPDDPQLRKGLAAALERMRRDAEAEQVLESLLESGAAHKQRALVLEVRGRLIALLAKRGRLAGRVGEYRRRFESGTGEVANAFGLLAADGFLKIGRNDLAEELLRGLVERAPSGDGEARADAYLGLAQVFRARHRLKDVIAALQKAADLSPARAREIYSQIAELSLQLYRDADAMVYAKKAIALGPNDAQAQVRLAEVLEKRDLVDEAVAAYERALQLDDRLWRADFALARLRLRRGEYAQAARLYREVIRRAPEEELVLDAARRATDLEEYLGSLGELERELAPLAYAHAERHVYRSLLVELYQRYARPLVARARQGDAAAQKELERLGEHGLRPLTDVLVDGDVAQQRLAITLLGELGNPSGAGPLLKLAATTPRAARTPARPGTRSPFDAPAAPGIDLRTDAAIAGARLASERDLPSLLKLAEEPEKQLRAAAMLGLGRIARPAAETALVRALSDGGPDVQALACLGLARAGVDAHATAEVVKVLRAPTRAERVRAACAIALGAELADAPAERAAAGRAALIETLAEGADDVQRKAAWALGAIGGRAAAPALVRAVYVKREPVRRAALEALARTGGPSLTRELGVPEYGSDGIDVREWIARFGPPGADTAPAASWRGLEDDVAAAIADALGRHRDLVLRTLADLDARADGLALGPLSSDDLGAAERAAVAAVGARIAPTLKRLLQHADATVRAGAARVLAKLDDLDAVGGALADPALEVRLAALAALARHPDERFAAAVEHALTSTDWRERRSAALAARAAGPMRRSPGRPSTLHALAAALDDADGYVREAAAQALGAEGGDGVAPLARRLDDDAPSVRAAIAAALGATGAAAARAPLAHLRGDADELVRRAAAEALERLPSTGN